MAKALAEEIPDEMKKIINLAVPYVEGSSIDIDVSDVSLLPTIMRLIEIMLANRV